MSGGGAHRFARVVRSLSIGVLLAWLVVGWLAIQQPHVNLTRGGAGLRDLAPVTLPSVQAELRAATTFPVPLHSRTLAVEHDPAGLAPQRIRTIVDKASPRAVQDPRWPDVIGGIPLVNQPPLAGSRAPAGTTAITYLVFDPSASATTRTRQARAYASAEGATAATAYTGAVPARLSTARTLRDALPRLELVTASVVTLAVLLFYRSLVAPLVVLASIALAYVVSQAALGMMARGFDREVPREVEPLLVALLLGIVTDYCIFHLSALRRELKVRRVRDAVHHAIASSTPVVFVAGLTVAAGCISLLLADTPFLAAFGPALAITVLVAATVSTTFVPALVSLLGPRALWPSPTGRPPGVAVAPEPRGRALGLVIARRPVAVGVAALVLVVLVVAALPLRETRLGYDAISGLPDDDPVRVGQLLAEQGFAAGIVSPTVLLVEGDGLDEHIPALVRFQRLVDAQPGVAGTFGAASVDAARSLVQNEGPLPALRDPLGLAVAPDGSAARLLVVLDEEPYGGRAVEVIEGLRADLPRLALRAGLPADVSASVAGDTAVVGELVGELRSDLLRVALGVIVLDLLLIAAFLRSVLAPLVVVLGSVLAVLASLGATTWIFQDLLGGDGIAFYVPLATLVLLLSLGADYGVYSVGHAWQLARRRPLREALVVGSAQTSRVVAVAGTLLGASFALLTLVPVDAFLQFACAMTIGVLLDTFVIRPVLLPTVLRAVGDAALWPGIRPTGASEGAAPVPGNRTG